jgi:hypothetical protein
MFGILVRIKTERRNLKMPGISTCGIWAPEWNRKFIRGDIIG